MASEAGVEGVMVLTFTLDITARLRSYAWLAKVFDLRPAAERATVAW